MVPGPASSIVEGSLSMLGESQTWGQQWHYWTVQRCRQLWSLTVWCRRWMCFSKEWDSFLYRRKAQWDEDRWLLNLELWRVVKDHPGSTLKGLWFCCTESSEMLEGESRCREEETSSQRTEELYEDGKSKSSVDDVIFNKLDTWRSGGCGIGIVPIDTC